MSEFSYRSPLIVGTASIKGFAQSAGLAMAKFALRGLAQSVVRELGPKGTHVVRFIVEHRRDRGPCLGPTQRWRSKKACDAHAVSRDPSHRPGPSTRMICHTFSPPLQELNVAVGAEIQKRDATETPQPLLGARHSARLSPLETDQSAFTRSSRLLFLRTESWPCGSSGRPRPTLYLYRVYADDRHPERGGDHADADGYIPDH
jgi:hypothetical protein